MDKKKKWVPQSQRLAREIAFLAAFYDPDSATYNDGKASAVSVGYTGKAASRTAENLLTKYREFDFKAIAHAMRIDRISIGLALGKILRGSGAPRDVLSAARLLLAIMGEMTDAASTQKNVNVNGPTMIILGGTPERIEALRRGGVPPQFARTQDLLPELPPAPDEDVIDIKAANLNAETLELKPTLFPTQDARRLGPSDFAGRNRGDVGI